MADFRSVENLQKLLGASRDIKEKKLLADKLIELSNKGLRTSSSVGDNFILKGKPSTISGAKPNFTLPTKGASVPTKAGNILPDIVGEVVDRTALEVGDDTAGALVKSGGIVGKGKSALLRLLGRAGKVAGPMGTAYTALESEGLGPQEGNEGYDIENPQQKPDMEGYGAIPDGALDLVEAPEEDEPTPQPQRVAHLDEERDKKLNTFQKNSLIKEVKEKGIDPQEALDLLKKDRGETVEEEEEVKETRADRLVSAQEADDKQRLINTMLRAGVQIGSGFGGAKADYSGVDALDKEAGRGVANLKQQFTTEKADEEEEQNAFLHDANSEVMNNINENYFKITGKNFKEGTTPYMIQKQGLNLASLMGMSQKKELAEKTLTNAKEIALAKAKDKADESMVKKNDKTLQKFRDHQTRIDGLMRGGKMKKQWDRYAAITEMKDKLESALSGTPITKEAAVDLSTTWSSVLMGGVPAQSLIFETLPKSVKGDFGSMVNYMTGKPTAGYFTPEMLKYMEKQMQLLEKNNNKVLGDFISKGLITYAPIIKDNPDELKYLKMKYEPYGVTFGKDGVPIVNGEDKAETPEDEQTGSSEYVKVTRISDGVSKKMKRDSVKNLDSTKYSIEDM